MSGTALALVEDQVERHTELDHLGASLRPDPPLSIDEWADAHRILPPVGSAKPGPWKTTRVPYMREVMRALSPTAPYEVVVMRASAQVAKTECILNVIGFVMDQAPAPILAIQPTVELAERFSRQRITPMIEATPRLIGKVAPRRSRDSGNTLLSKEFTNGILVMAGANSAAGLRSMPAKIVLADEVDAYPANVDAEGDPIELAKARTETFVQSKTLLTSTPTMKGVSRIELALEQCEQRAEWQMPCPHCQYEQALVFERLEWPAGKPLEAAYRCAGPGCERLIEHRYKPWMVRNGRWVRTKDEGSRSIGFAINQLSSTLGKTTWGMIAEKYEKAKDNPSLMRVFVNTVLGLPYADAHEAPEWRRLYERRSAYEEGVVPPGVVFLTAGVDVQKDRVEIEVVGWGREKRSWSVTYRLLEGDTARPEVWEALSAFLALDWPCAGGGTLPIRVMAVDAGYATQHVYTWSRRHPRAVWSAAGVRAPAVRTVVPVKGTDDWNRVLGTPQAVDARKRKGTRVQLVGAANVKRELYDWLRLELPTEAEAAGGRAVPPGFCFFPEYGEGWFKQLTAERVVLRQVHGFPKPYWEKDAGARNEALDCRVYARAAAAIFGLDRFTERQWAEVEAAAPAGLGTWSPAPARTSSEDPPAAAAPTTSPAIQAPGVPAPEEPEPAPAPRPRRARRIIRSSWLYR